MKTKLFFNIATIILLAFSVVTTQHAEAQGVKTAIIDPGHGGAFPGAQYGGYTEKAINLNIALRLNELLQKRHPDIKVILTRTKDVALGKTLREDLAARSKIANDASGDLFVSIHANAASSTAAYGAETIIMGESSLEKQRNDAALYTANKEHLIDMSDEKTAAIVRAYIQNLQFTYGQYSEALARLIQKSYGDKGRKVRNLRRQPIMVLYGTDMPCVLTEIGFMSNANELAYMTSSKGAAEIAESIYEGIKNYIAMVNRTSQATAPAPTTTTPTTTKAATTAATSKRGYTIQILSSGKTLSTKDSQFKSYRGKVWERVTGGSYKYKYCIGKYKTEAEAIKHLKEVRKSFKDAYVTTY
ncbi:MAG: N-acetylmuramoyl-L-alanine amidase [Rikenellaceae bacterium]